MGVVCGMILSLTTEVMHYCIPWILEKLSNDPGAGTTNYFDCCLHQLSINVGKCFIARPWFSWGLVGDKTLPSHLCFTRLMCSPLASNFWSTPVLVHKVLIHAVMTSLPWQTGLQSWQSCTIALAHSLGYEWRTYWDSLSEGLISYMCIQSDSDLTGLINSQGVCVTRLMCSPLATNIWSTPVLLHKVLIHAVMTSLPWQTGLQGWQSSTLALVHSVGYKWLPIRELSPSLPHDRQGYLPLWW